MDYFGKEADYLGSSPRMFTDYSWYKDIWFDYIADCKRQFALKNANLMLANMKEEIRVVSSEMVELRELISHSKLLSREYENTKNQHLLDEIFKCHIQVQKIMGDKSADLSVVLSQVRDALQDVLEDIDEFDFAKYPQFFSAFGRTLQYMSFVKK